MMIEGKIGGVCACKTHTNYQIDLATLGVKKGVMAAESDYLRI